MKILYIEYEPLDKLLHLHLGSNGSVYDGLHYDAPYVQSKKNSDHWKYRL